MPQPTNIVGEVRMTAAVSVPTGWLPCDGAAVSRTDYAALFAAIQNAYGAGDGSTTFNVPDLRGRSPIGAGAATSSTTRRARGDAPGTEAVTLSATESGVAAHNHTQNPHTHTFVDSGFTPGVTDEANPAGGIGHYMRAAAPVLTIANATATNQAHPGAGAVAAHNNMQPSLALQFMICWDAG